MQEPLSFAPHCPECALKSHRDDLPHCGGLFHFNARPHNTIHLHARCSQNWLGPSHPRASPGVAGTDRKCSPPQMCLGRDASVPPRSLSDETWLCLGVAVSVCESPITDSLEGARLHLREPDWLTRYPFAHNRLMWRKQMHQGTTARP